MKLGRGGYAAIAGDYENGEIIIKKEVKGRTASNPGAIISYSA